MRLAVILAGSAALTLGGCVPTIRPVPLAATVVAPADWRDPISAATANTDKDWWRLLGDPAIPLLIERALSSNTDVLAAVARVDEAEAVMRQARATRLPSLTAGVETSIQQSPGQTGGASRSELFQPSIDGAWNLDLFQRNRKLEGAARARYSASRAERDAARLAVISSTIRGYVTLLSLEAQADVSRSTLASRREALRIASDRANLGYSSQFELTQAQSEYESVAQTVPVIEQAVRVQENALRRLTGDLPGPISRGRLANLTVPATPAGLSSTLLRRRPDLASAEFNLVAADRILASRRADFLPDVQLTGSVGALFSDALNWNPVTLWDAGASILAPMFSGGRLKADFDVATAQRDQAAFAYRGAVLTAFGEVEDALSGERRLREQAARVMSRRDILRKSLVLAQDRYQGGYAAYIEELDAQRNLFQADLDAIEVREQQLNTLVQLWAALGGGWEVTGGRSGPLPPLQSEPTARHSSDAMQ